MAKIIFLNQIIIPNKNNINNNNNDNNNVSINRNNILNESNNNLCGNNNTNNREYSTKTLIKTNNYQDNIMMKKKQLGMYSPLSILKEILIFQIHLKMEILFVSFFISRIILS